MELKINVHSVIDVITNSSTMVFITMVDGAVDSMYKIIDEILKVANSDKKAKDLFDITQEYDWDTILDYFRDECDSVESEKENIMGKIWDTLEGKARKDFENEKVIPYLKESGRYKDYLEDGDGLERDNWLVIKAKDESKSTQDIWRKIINLINVEATYS